MPDKVVMDREAISEAISRITSEILQKNQRTSELSVIGVRTRGIHLAQRIIDKIGKVKNVKPPLGMLDITLYRDDFRRKSEWPKVQKTEIPFSVEDKKVVLVDDVLYTGRTVRAAIDAIMDYGRPASVQLAVLIDRGLRELPFQADYVGKTITTLPTEEVKVLLSEIDEKDEVVIIG